MCVSSRARHTVSCNSVVCCVCLLCVAVSVRAYVKFHATEYSYLESTLTRKFIELRMNVYCLYTTLLCTTTDSLFACFLHRSDFMVCACVCSSYYCFFYYTCVCMWSALLHIQHSYDVKREMQKKQHIQG